MVQPNRSPGAMFRRTAATQRRYPVVFWFTGA
jgi:hypothetical protein